MLQHSTMSPFIAIFVPVYSLYSFEKVALDLIFVHLKPARSSVTDYVVTEIVYGKVVRELLPVNPAALDIKLCNVCEDWNCT